MMTLDEVIEIIGGTEAAHDYLQGIVEGSEAARNARRALRAAIQYMKGAGVKYATAEALPELFSQCAFELMADWSEETGNQIEGARTNVSIGTRQILLQLRYSKENREATE